MYTAVVVFVKREIKLKNICDSLVLKLQVSIAINSQETNLTITAIDYF